MAPGAKSLRGRPRGPRPSSADVLELRATGATWEEVAARFGVKRQTVLRVLKEAGVEPGKIAAPPREISREPAGAPKTPAPPLPASAPPLAAPAAPSERARQLIHDPRLVLEEMAELATDRGVPASQRFRAQKMLSDALLGKAKAGQPVGFGASGQEAPATRFDPSKLPREEMERYLAALEVIVDIETRFSEVDAPAT